MCFWVNPIAICPAFDQAGEATDLRLGCGWGEHYPVRGPPGKIGVEPYARPPRVSVQRLLGRGSHGTWAQPKANVTNPGSGPPGETSLGQGQPARTPRAAAQLFRMC